MRGSCAATHYVSPPSQAELNPGDVLFIPRFWYHHVRCLTPCVSINYFASTPLEFLRERCASGVRHALHLMGLVGNGNCVCHDSGRRAAGGQLHN